MKDALLHDYAREHPSEFAAVLLRHSYEEARELLEVLDEEETLALLAVLPGSWLQRALDGVGDARIALWLRDADSDLAIDLLARVRSDRRAAILAALPDARRRAALEERLAWPAGTLGAVAERSFLALPTEATVGQLAAELRAQGASAGVSEVLLLDEGGRLRGTVDLRRALGMEDSSTPLRRCLQSTRSLPGEMQASVAVELPLWRQARSVPVVDRRRRPIGIVTLDRARDALRGTQPEEGRAELAAQLGADFLEVLARLLGLLMNEDPTGSRSGRKRP
ncbi:MAG: CBS domain-containing protein [Pseudomonadales bacterium]|nr:CBS domain-containing protein [Pseudomonadales bacterium]